jgi:N-acetyl sugar amidotransferase
MVTTTNEKGYQQCAISVMDNIADPRITFDAKGICNYFYQYNDAEQNEVFTGMEGERRLAEVVEKIKSSGRGKPYDCITGVSGGVDSTYLALQAKKLGLRPLLVHFDNGWNSELSVMNIENIISRLGFDLHTLVVDWNEFKDIQMSYLKASVVDIEAITDHAIIGTLYSLAVKHGIKYILSGTNIVTEFVLPSYWIWSKTDHVNIKAIHKKFGTVPLKTFPFFSKRLKHYYARVKGIETISLLNYMPYEKALVKQVITDELGWRDYGGKHYESVFTRFYQGYILPTKFHIDKRKAHLSTLIFSGQITKEAAIAELNKPIYDAAQFKSDYEFVLKKFGWSDDEFQNIISMPRKEHSDYAHEKNNVWDNYPVLKPFRGLWRKLKS